MVTALILILVVGGLLYVRFAPSNPDHWHVDPLITALSSRPNQFLHRPEEQTSFVPDFDLSGAELSNKLEGALNDIAGAKLLAGSLADGWATYIIRTPKMGYPDYFSVRVIELGTQKSTLAIYSRSRFGYRDFNVNRSRVRKLVQRLSLS